MILFLNDTEMTYSEISHLLNVNVGPVGPDSWQMVEIKSDTVNEFRRAIRTAVIIHRDCPGTTVVALAW